MARLKPYIPNQYALAGYIVEGILRYDLGGVPQFHVTASREGGSVIFTEATSLNEVVTHAGQLSIIVSDGERAVVACLRKGSVAMSILPLEKAEKLQQDSVAVLIATMRSDLPAEVDSEKDLTEEEIKQAVVFNGAMDELFDQV